MNRKRLFDGSLGAAGLAALLVCAPVCFAQTTTVKPTEINSLLANPDIGWETFQTVNSSGITTPFPANADSSVPSWMPTTINYVRPSWAEMEPSQGILSNWLDDALAGAAASGQKLDLQAGVTLRWPPDVSAVPQWALKAGITETNLSGSLVPNYSSTTFVNLYVQFIQLLGAKYDSNPNLGTIYISGIGNGENEWQMSPFCEDNGSQYCMPAFTYEQPIIQAFAQAFPHHPLTIPIDSGGADEVSGNFNQALGYATLAEHSGWFGACFGDTKYAMPTAYPYYVNEASNSSTPGNPSTGPGVNAAWRNGPVALESCYDIASWVSEGYPSDFTAVFNYGLNAHASVINNKSIGVASLTSTQTAELQAFIQRLGYRFVLNQITFPNTVSTGGSASMSMQWQNVGSAPCYAKTYLVGYRLTGSGGDTHFFTGQINPCTFMPGDIGYMPGAAFLANPVPLPNGPVNTVTDLVTVPSGLPAGKYAFAVGIVDTSSVSKAAVKLAISGIDSTGWYPMGNMMIR